MVQPRGPCRPPGLPWAPARRGSRAGARERLQRVARCRGASGPENASRCAWERCHSPQALPREGLLAMHRGVLARASTAPAQERFLAHLGRAVRGAGRWARKKRRPAGRQ